MQCGVTREPTRPERREKGHDRTHGLWPVRDPAQPRTTLRDGHGCTTRGQQGRLTRPKFKSGLFPEFHFGAKLCAPGEPGPVGRAGEEEPKPEPSQRLFDWSFGAKNAVFWLF